MKDLLLMSQCNLTSPPQEYSVNYGKECGTVTKPLDENEGFTRPSQHFKRKAENDGVSPERVDATQEGEQVLNPVSSETCLKSSSSNEKDHIPESGGNYGDKKEDFPTDVSEVSADKDDSITELMPTRHNSPFKNMKFWNQVHTSQRK